MHDQRTSRSPLHKWKNKAAQSEKKLHEFIHLKNVANFLKNFIESFHQIYKVLISEE